MTDPAADAIVDHGARRAGERAGISDGWHTRWPSSWMSDSGFVGVTAPQLPRRTIATSRSSTTRACTSSVPGSTREAGKVFCLATGPSRKPSSASTSDAGHPSAEVYELTVEVA